MKNKYCLLLIALISFSCNLRKPSIDTVQRTKMEIVDPVRHYYPILRGSELTSSYKFYNRGNQPLIIYDVQASCGCIDVNFPSNSIGKNDFGFITVDYDSAKNIGYVEFYITIVANTEKDVFNVLKFDLNVVTSPHYTKDYEEIYLDRRKAKLAEGIEGDLTQQGYDVPEESKTVR
tara:strand:- start:7128 stop:7655 length:528 start_codon:yes stop_codon:yes gene_type:complete